MSEVKAEWAALVQCLSQEPDQLGLNTAARRHLEKLNYGGVCFVEAFLLLLLLMRLSFQILAASRLQHV